MSPIRLPFVILFIFCLGLNPCWGQTQFFSLPGSFTYALNSINQVADVNSAGTIGIALRSDPNNAHTALLTTFVPATGQALDSKSFGFGPLGVKLAEIPEGLRAVVLTSQGGPRNIFLFSISSTGLIASIAQTPLTNSINDGGSNLVVSPSGKAGFALVYAPTGTGKDIVGFSLVDGSILGRVHIEPVFNGQNVLTLVDASDGRRLLAFPSQPAEVTVVDATDVAQPVLQKVPLVASPPPGVPSSGVGFSPDGRYLYASSSLADLSVIDTQTLSVLGSVGGTFHYGAMEVSEGVSGIQIASYGGIGATPSITLIDAKDPAHPVALQHYSPAGLSAKSGFKFSKDGRRLYIATSTVLVGLDVPSLHESIVIPVSGSRQAQQILSPAFCAPEKVLAAWGIDSYFGSANLAPNSVSGPASPDSDGDGKSDIAWQRSDGSTTIWLMDGTALKGGAGLLGPGSGWSIKRRADFNGDGKNDILWQHADGSTAIWLMDGLNLSGGALLIGPGTGWSVTDVGDFNGDGKGDLAWQHSNGSTAIWLMNGLTLAGGAGLLGANTGWSVKQIGDFDGDGKSDILWQHSDGSAAVWLMNGLNLSAGAGLLGPGQWSAKLIGDFNGDGKSDILWQHSDGSTAMWLMNGLGLNSGSIVLGPATGWSPANVGDFNGDGKGDIVWQHTDGSVAIWLVDGLGILSGTIVRPPGTGYSVSRVGDFNGDGKSDILWQHADGSTVIWLMDGLNPVTIGSLLGPATGWCPAP